MRWYKSYVTLFSNRLKVTVLLLLFRSVLLAKYKRCIQSQLNFKTSIIVRIVYSYIFVTGRYKNEWEDEIAKMFYRLMCDVM